MARRCAAIEEVRTNQLDNRFGILSTHSVTSDESIAHDAFRKSRRQIAIRAWPSSNHNIDAWKKFVNLYGTVLVVIAEKVGETFCFEAVLHGVKPTVRTYAFKKKS
jgi:hypothetical protein